MKWLMKNSCLLFLLFTLCLYSHTIEEKQESLLLKKDEGSLYADLSEINIHLRQLRRQMEEKYAQAYEYYKDSAKEEEYYNLLNEVRGIRFAMQSLEKKWHDLAVTEAKKEDEGYALWDQDEIELSHLIMEYGSNDYLYIIPPEVLSMKLRLYSGIPIPRESWSELLEVILSHNGIGIKQLNPHARQLYILKQDLITVDQILSSPKDLVYIPPQARIAYVFSPRPERIKEVFQFFDRFRDPKVTFIYQVGYKIALISSKDEVAKLLALHEAIWEKENEKLTKVLPLSRIKLEEMEKIVRAYFGHVTHVPHMGSAQEEEKELIIFPLKSEGSLVLIGTKDLVERAERVVKETERQIEDPMEMTLFLYTCRHNDPVDMAEVLEKVYASLIYSKIDGQQTTPSEPVSTLSVPSETAQPSSSPYARMATPPVETQKKRFCTTNFIPYPKTGSIMMVVRRDTLDKIKELIHKLDVPKKMVQIEVLLFEKRMKNSNNFGLNILRLGSAAHNIHATGIRYETTPGIPSRGIFEFFLFRKKSQNFWPAFDIAYNFLMTQEDVHINAAPSVTTLNQTPAQIALVEEISIDMGAAPVDTSKGISYIPQFVRSQYGTTLTITPTVHDPDLSEKHFITLETSIMFDTIKKTTHTDRPPVSRRRIDNHVRVVDGETVILGGLREKTSEETTNKLPFLGEIPGIGKFFSDSHMTDERTEIFVFITPHILFDGREQAERLHYEQLLKRPGDVPEFIQRVQETKKRNRARLLTNSLQLFFGHVDG